ncbi:MAG: A/G-specific adenine glycosylase [Acidobacteriaceae bacterium]
MPLSGSLSEKRTLVRAQKALLEWYSRERRLLPWRETQDPYRIWVSEMMLQQTRVAAVLEYYRRFLATFPDVFALAEAREAEVLAAWTGLGYYRRARAMHAAARKIVAELGGKFPSSTTALAELPGIGRYTAAAVTSIAFAKPAAVVDGNVERVLVRLLGKDLARRDEAWEVAEKLLPPKYPGDWNQAMMELGATLCLPVGAKCLLCPLRHWCADPGRQTRKDKPARNKRELVFGLAERRGAVYLVQRKSDARVMARMWELPLSEENGSPILRTRHSITNSDYAVTVFSIKTSEVSGGKWFSRKALAQLPVTGLTRKILRAANLWPDGRI